MAIGMTYEQYWYGDPLMVRAYYKAYKLKREQIDEESWLNGMYVFKALDATVGNMFRKQGQSPAEYPREPVLLSKKKEEAERKNREKTEREKEDEATWAFAWMNSFVQAGKNFGKNKKREG